MKKIVWVRIYSAEKAGWDLANIWFENQKKKVAKLWRWYLLTVLVVIYFIDWNNSFTWHEPARSKYGLSLHEQGELSGKSFWRDQSAFSKSVCKYVL
jgi:hypothetical protein